MSYLRSLPDRQANLSAEIFQHMNPLLRLKGLNLYANFLNKLYNSF